MWTVGGGSGSSSKCCVAGGGRFVFGNEFYASPRQPTHLEGQGQNNCLVHRLPYSLVLLLTTGLLRYHG